MDITPLVKGENMTDSGWSAKEQAIQEDFLWGVGPEALYQITRAEYKTEPDSIKVKDLIRLITEFYMPKRNTYHNRGFLLGETNRRGNTGRLLETTNRNRKRM